MAKPMLVTVPCVLLLVDYWPLGRFRPAAGARPKAASGSWLARLPIPWRLAVEKIPLVVQAAVSSGIVVWTDSSLQLNDQVDRLSLATCLANALVAYAAYLGQSLYPVGLAPFYPHPGTHVPIAWAAEALVLLTAITAGCVSAARRPYLPVGWLWFLGMLVPVSGLVGTFVHARADRYTYLSQIGLSIALAWSVWTVYRSRQSLRPASWRRWLLAAVSGGAVLVLAAVAWRQTSYWCNAETLWTRAIACTEQNLVAHFNLANIYTKQGKTTAAIAHLRAAAAADSPYRQMSAAAHDLLADQLLLQGKTDEAFCISNKQCASSQRASGRMPRCACAGLRGPARRGHRRVASDRPRGPQVCGTRLSLADALLSQGAAGEAADRCRDVLRRSRIRSKRS